MMSKRISILIFASVLLLGHHSLASDIPHAELLSQTNAPAAAAQAANSFQDFRIIAERNIFNQNRSRSTGRRDTPPPKAAPVIHALSLVGTMSFEKGNFAFFDGTRTEFKKSFKEGESIAGYEIKEINPASVRIANQTNQFELKVGQQLRREDGSEWQLSSAPLPTQTAVTDSSASTGTNSASSAESGSEDEALKRLMEKRAKEINQ